MGQLLSRESQLVARDGQLVSTARPVAGCVCCGDDEPADGCPPCFNTLCQLEEFPYTDDATCLTPSFTITFKAWPTSAYVTVEFESVLWLLGKHNPCYGRVTFPQNPILAGGGATVLDDGGIGFVPSEPPIRTVGQYPLFYCQDDGPGGDDPVIEGEYAVEYRFIDEDANAYLPRFDFNFVFPSPVKASTTCFDSYGAYPNSFLIPIMAGVYDETVLVEMDAIHLTQVLP